MFGEGRLFVIAAWSTRLAVWSTECQLVVGRVSLTHLNLQPVYLLAKVPTKVGRVLACCSIGKDCYEAQRCFQPRFYQVVYLFLFQ